MRQTVDWDAALVEAIPAVAQADSTKAYAAALQAMLDHLDDSSTRIDSQAQGARSTPTVIDRHFDAAQRQPTARMLDGSIGLIAANRWTAIVREAGGLHAINKPLFARAFETVSAAKVVILDLRRVPADIGPEAFDEAAWMLPKTLETDIAAAVHGNIALPAPRSRMHYGKSNDDLTSGAYYAGVVTQYHSYIEGRRPADDRRFVFIVNAGSVGLDGLLSGMQSHRLAAVIVDGDKPLPVNNLYGDRKSVV